MEISNTRNIVKTDIQGRDGSVKEFINNGDYQISIKGILSNDVFIHLMVQYHRKVITNIQWMWLHILILYVLHLAQYM